MSPVDDQETELLRPIDFGNPDGNEYEDMPEGELMTLHEFVQAVDAGAFTDDDGHGVFASATHRSERRVLPSDVPPPEAEAVFHVTWYPAWATHVLWYNK